jgi:hypothetical protein
MELKFRFFLLSIKADHDEALPGALEFLTSIGMYKRWEKEKKEKKEGREKGGIF